MGSPSLGKVRDYEPLSRRHAPLLEKRRISSHFSVAGLDWLAFKKKRQSCNHFLRAGAEPDGFRKSDGIETAFPKTGPSFGKAREV